MQALRRFTETEGLTPADVAAEAIFQRFWPVIDGRSRGWDMRTEDPELYASIEAGRLAVNHAAISAND